MSMNVKELIALLKKEKPEALVILSLDREGDLFSPLSKAKASIYRSVRPWYGELEDDAEPSKEDGTVAAVVLWPST